MKSRKRWDLDEGLSESTKRRLLATFHSSAVRALVNRLIKRLIRQIVKRSRVTFSSVVRRRKEEKSPPTQ
jgi:hypothetical protein